MSSASITKHDIGKLKLIWDDPIHPCNCLVVFKALHGFVKEIVLFFSFELYSGSTQSIAKILSLLSVTLKHDCCIRISILTPKGKSLKPWYLARTWFLARYHLKLSGRQIPIPINTYYTLDDVYYLLYHLYPCTLVLML